MGSAHPVLGTAIRFALTALASGLALGTAIASVITDDASRAAFAGLGGGLALAVSAMSLGLLIDLTKGAPRG